MGCAICDVQGSITLGDATGDASDVDAVDADGDHEVGNEKLKLGTTGTVVAVWESCEVSGEEFDFGCRSGRHFETEPRAGRGGRWRFNERAGFGEFETGFEHKSADCNVAGGDVCTGCDSRKRNVYNGLGVASTGIRD